MKKIFKYLLRLICNHDYQHKYWTGKCSGIWMEHRYECNNCGKIRYEWR